MRSMWMSVTASFSPPIAVVCYPADLGRLRGQKVRVTGGSNRRHQAQWCMLSTAWAGPCQRMRQGGDASVSFPDGGSHGKFSFSLSEMFWCAPPTHPPALSLPTHTLHPLFYFYFFKWSTDKRRWLLLNSNFQFGKIVRFPKVLPLKADTSFDLMSFIVRHLLWSDYFSSVYWTILLC